MHTTRVMMRGWQGWWWLYGGGGCSGGDCKWVAVAVGWVHLIYNGSDSFPSSVLEHQQLVPPGEDHCQSQPGRRSAPP